MLDWDACCGKANWARHGYWVEGESLDLPICMLSPSRYYGQQHAATLL